MGSDIPLDTIRWLNRFVESTTYRGMFDCAKQCPTKAVESRLTEVLLKLIIIASEECSGKRLSLFLGAGIIFLYIFFCFKHKTTTISPLIRVKHLHVVFILNKINNFTTFEHRTIFEHAAKPASAHPTIGLQPAMLGIRFVQFLSLQLGSQQETWEETKANRFD